MKRLIGVLLALLLVAPVAAQSPQIRQLMLRQMPVVAAGGGCSQATTFLARTSGLSGTESTAYTNLICGMVTDGTWALMDAVYIFATNTTTTANLNLVSTSFGLTATGSPTFTADQGYTGNGTTSFLNTGFSPSTAAGNYTLNSASTGAYVLTSRTTGGTLYAMGGNGTGAGNENIALVPKFGDGNGYAQINNGSVAFAMANAKGLLVGTRTASNLSTEYKFDGTNNGSVGTDSAASTTLLPTSIYILAVNSNGTAQNFTTDQLSSAFIGGGLNSTQVGQVSSRINAYMTALGINVY